MDNITDEDIRGLDHPADEVACTGTTARWCPRCGDCTCGPHPADLDKPTCSLHGARSSHPAHPPSTVIPERVSDDPITSALRDVGAEHTPPPDWQHRVLKKVEGSDAAATIRDRWYRDVEVIASDVLGAERIDTMMFCRCVDRIAARVVDLLCRRTEPTGLTELARGNAVALTFDRTELDRCFASIESTMIHTGRIAEAHRCAIARDLAHPHSAGEAAALLLGLPSPYPERASGDRSLTLGGAT